MVVAHTFNPSIQKAEKGGSTEFQSSLAYTVNSMTAQTRQPNPVCVEMSKKKKEGRKTGRNSDTECGKELELAQGKVISR